MSVSTSKKTGRGKTGKTSKLPSMHVIDKSLQEALIEPYSTPSVMARHEIFARAYTKKRNATLAAIEAGYSPKTAYSQGSRLLKNVELQRRIESYGQLGLDTLAEIAHDDSYNELARVNAAKALTERAYGMAKNSDKQAVGNITINFNRVDVTDIKQTNEDIKTIANTRVDAQTDAAK